LQNFTNFGPVIAILPDGARECLEKLVPVASQLDENLPAVVGAGKRRAAAADQTVDQFHVVYAGAAIRSAKTPSWLRPPADRESRQQLMLLRSMPALRAAFR